MNLFVLGIILFVLIYLGLVWFARASKKKIAQFLKKTAIIVSLILAILLIVGGRFLFSLPLIAIILSSLKLKGFTAFQILQLWRLLQYLRSTGRFSYGSSQTNPSSAITVDESYKILGLKRGCSKEEVIQTANKLQKKIHPDLNRDINTERISQLVNEAKENIIKTDFA